MTTASIMTDFDTVLAIVRERLAQNKRIRRNLPCGGRLRMDRQLPFLCLYREPTDREDFGTRELVTTEAAYLTASGKPAYHSGLMELCQAIAETIEENFGLFLLLEIWADEDLPDVARVGNTQPEFRLVIPQQESPLAAKPFLSRLEEIELYGQKAKVEVRNTQRVSPPGLQPVELPCLEAQNHCVHLGIAVRPIYRNRASGHLYPIVLHSLRRQLAIALRKAIFGALGRAERTEPAHYESLGPSAFVKSARLVDQQLSEVSQSFDFLLQVTPVNASSAWEEYCQSKYRTEPTLYYRPLPYHPSDLKRRLFEIPIGRIEDATLTHLFWEKQEELDRKITALRDIGTPHFLSGSLQLYGPAEEDLVRLATEILQRVPVGSGPGDSEHIYADAIASEARDHFDYYHERLPDFNARLEVCDHIASGLMVSKDCLYISENACVCNRRLPALLHHEIGTHLVTYFNGRQQPFRQLYAGLAGYEELQEGLGVLAEYLAGGLTSSRLRAIAGRVIAVDSMISGASFNVTFEKLHEEHRFAARTAFTTALRVYRGGGFTKDVIYLRGLRDLLDYLRQGHKIEPLYVGKIALAHVPLVREMRRRRIIQPPVLLPRLWEEPQLQQRLDACREKGVIELVEPAQ